MDEAPVGGVVIKKISGAYHVRLNHEVIVCGLAPALTDEGVTVGDEVTLDSAGRIARRLPRRSRFSRRSALPMPGAHAHEQVIVANLDLVVAVFAAAQPKPSWNLLDRYLVSAESLDLPVVVCLTKMDLTGETDGEIEAAVQEYRRLGYSVLPVCAPRGDGMGALRETLCGRFSALIGKSGVGKTSLLNALLPQTAGRTAAVSRVGGKGRHTTVHLECFDLPDGGRVVDTPGMREFGLWEIESRDLALYFPEMRPFVGRCRFGMDCAHLDEPGCAVRRAVMDGRISPRRYQSMLRMKDDCP